MLICKSINQLVSKFLERNFTWMSGTKLGLFFRFPALLVKWIDVVKIICYQFQNQLKTQNVDTIVFQEKKIFCFIWSAGSFSTIKAGRVCSEKIWFSLLIILSRDASGTWKKSRNWFRAIFPIFAKYLHIFWWFFKISRI